MDVSPAGFGYIGQTPLARNFTRDEMAVWVERQTENGRTATFDSVVLNLKVSDKGYDDFLLPNIRIPVGQERTFLATLDPVLTEIAFDSDPEDVHVYVVRTIQKDILNDATGEITNTPVRVKVWLGKTPFPFHPDGGEPLRHGDELLWEKSGYDASLNTTQFAEGQARIHHVMETRVKQ